MKERLKAHYYQTSTGDSFVEEYKASQNIERWVDNMTSSGTYRYKLMAIQYGSGIITDFDGCCGRLTLNVSGRKAKEKCLMFGLAGLKEDKWIHTNKLLEHFEMMDEVKRKGSR